MVVLENKKEYFDDGGDPRKLSASSGEFLKLSDKAMGGEERRVFEDILRSMVVYNPEKRITANEVVARLRISVEHAPASSAGTDLPCRRGEEHRLYRKYKSANACSQFRSRSLDNLKALGALLRRFLLVLGAGMG